MENCNKKIHHTIFDDVSRTMVEKLPHLLIQVINEVFCKDYEEDTPIISLMNEHMELNGEKVITDACVRIGRATYHIECQSTLDGTIVLRMFEYDFVIALDDIQEVNGRYKVTFPKSAVLYLRHSGNTPDTLTMEVELAEGNVVMYSVPLIKVQDYTKDEIFQKKLLFYLPYYILRYENTLPAIEKEKTERLKLQQEYESIIKNIYDTFTEQEAVILCELIIRIVDYVAEKEKKVRKEVDRIMHGQVLELAGERGERKGREMLMISLIRKKKDKGYSIGEIADALEVEETKIEEMYTFLEKYPKDTVQEIWDKMQE